MKKIMIMFLVLAASVAGVCFAGDNNTGNQPNPPVAGEGGPNTHGGVDNSVMDNSYTNNAQ